MLAVGEATDPSCELVLLRFERPAHAVASLDLFAPLTASRPAVRVVPAGHQCTDPVSGQDLPVLHTDAAEAADAGGSPPLPTSPHPSSLPGASADGITTPHESHTCRLHVAAHVPALTPPTPYRSRHRWLRFKPLVVGPADQAGPAHAAGTISKLYVYLLGTMDYK